MPISGLMVKVKLVVNIEKFKIMDYKKLLGDIINAIPQTDCFKQQRGEQMPKYATRYKKRQSRSVILFKLSGTSVFIPTPESIGSV